MPLPALVEPLRRWDPEQVGGYVLLGRLGAGAMGQVYLGRSAAGRLVAVKTIKSELAEEPDFRTRFGQEVAAARRVSGAFTAAVVAADSEADVPWLATVYIPAPSLSKLVRRCGPLPVAAARWLMAGCAEALEAIHGVGLVHRDLKPSNVLVSPDGPRVIDFGVARAAERIQLTVTRGSIGTPAYMAPEQARDTRQATAASDVFSLGATTLFAATGHAPYQGETVMDVLVRLATDAPDLTGLPAELADIVLPCLDRDPRNRPTTASIVAGIAPGLAASGELGSAPLPAEALRLIEDYRQAPAPGPVFAGPASGGADETEESTLGSQPRLGPPGAAAGRRHRPARQLGRRALLTMAPAAAACGLFGAGWAIGTAVADDDRPAPLGPVAGQPLPPGVQADGPIAYLMQPIGDRYTTFAVHGVNWPRNREVTVTLVGVRTSPIRPYADGAGMFYYVINQNREFFSGRLPVGTYTVRIAGADGTSAQARFEVELRPPPPPQPTP